jgi:predicted  nucleic acid-binding Zn-ribbon protein
VAIELNLREGQVNKFFRKFWQLKQVDKLYQIYPQIEHYLPSFLKLHKALKKRGLNPNNVEWFADAIETGVIEIPDLQKQYAKVKDKLEAIDYKKTMTKYQLDGMNNQITYLNRISYSKRNEIAYLKIGVQELEGYVHGLENHNQQQEVQNE